MLLTRNQYWILGLACTLVACGNPPSIREDSANRDRPAVLEDETRHDGNVPWPSETEVQSDLEILLQLPVGTPPIESYLERAGRLTALCMAEGGYPLQPGEPMGDKAHDRLSNAIVYRGTTVTGGCEAWGMNYAFPGNVLSEYYRPLRAAALQRPEYLAVLAEYDSCFREHGYDAPPDVSGLSDEQAQAAMDGYSAAGNKCDQSAGLTNADRAAEMLVENTLVAEHRPQVDAYVTAILADLASIDSKGSRP